MISAIIYVYRALIVVLFVATGIIAVLLASSGVYGVLLALLLFVMSTVALGVSAILIGIYDRLRPAGVQEKFDNTQKLVGFGIIAVVLLWIFAVGFGGRSSENSESALTNLGRESGTAFGEPAGGTEPLQGEVAPSESSKKKLSPPDKNGCVKELAEEAGLSC